MFQTPEEWETMLTKTEWNAEEWGWLLESLCPFA